MRSKYYGARAAWTILEARWRTGRTAPPSLASSVARRRQLHRLRRCNPRYAPDALPRMDCAGRPPARLGRPPFAFARNHVHQSSLEHLGLRGEGSTPVPLPPPDIIENIGFLSNLVDKPPGTPHNTGRRERAGDLFPGCRGHSRPTAHAHSEAMMRAVRTPMSLHRNVQSTRHTPIARKNSLTVAAVARAART
jgi:hypothetical protein